MGEVPQYQSLEFLLRVSKIPIGTAIHVVDAIADYEGGKVGNIVYWQDKATENLWFVGRIDGRYAIVPFTEFTQTYEEGRFDTSGFLSRLAAIEGDSEHAAQGRIDKALADIDGRVSRLTLAQDRFRRTGFPEKAAGCGRAIAELMPLKSQLRGENQPEPVVG